MRLSIITLGHVHSEDLAPLTTRFDHLEQLVLDIPPRDELANHRAELNRAVDAASTDWLLIVREREMIDDALATEIRTVAEDAKARGFRIRSIPFYAGKPLRLNRDDGELRLFHRRSLLRRGEVAVQGTIVRLANPLRSITFASADEHRDYLAKNAHRRSAIKRVLMFAGYLLGVRTLDANTRRYLWIEAGYSCK
jgi:hypothetical protein